MGWLTLRAWRIKRLWGRIPVVLLTGVLTLVLALVSFLGVNAPPAGPTAEYGKYVATFGECRGCHGPDMTGTPATVLNEEIPNPRPFVETLSLEQFVNTLRTGIRPDGRELEMPWENASKMTDTDLEALYVFLTTDP